MNHLLEAAKAVIEQWDRNGYPIELVLWEPVKQLRSAVERAEMKEAVGFEGWWENFSHYRYDECQAAWTAAQQAERERLRQKVAEIIRLEDFDDVMAIFDD